MASRLKTRYRKQALKFTLIYALFGVLWIGLSDTAILLFTDDPATLTLMQNLKGWLYILVTAVLVLFLINRAQDRQFSLIDRLFESESRFRSIFESVNDGILIHDLERDHIVDTNPRMRRMFGCTVNQARVLSIEELSAPQPDGNLETARDHIERARAGQPSRFEWHVARPDGGTFWAEVTIRSTLIDKRPHCVMVVRDISERKASYERLRLAAAVFESSRDGIVITDSRPAIITANPAYCQATGYRLDQVEGRDPAFIRENSGEDDSRLMWSSLREKGYWEGEIRVRNQDGQSRDNRLNVTAVSGDGGETAHYVGVYSDITDLRQAQRRLEDLAYFDPLTRLPNRLLFHYRAESALNRARDSGQSLAVIYLDLDNFKNVNDSFGHPLGDDLLVAVTRRLQEQIDKVEIDQKQPDDRALLAHLGGDEFAILIESIDDPDQVTRFTQSLLEDLESPFAVAQSNNVYMSASAGISIYPEHAETSVELMQYAHAAMYLAKKKGRNQTCWFTPRLIHNASERLQLEARLHAALEDEEFHLHYQPIRSGARGEKTIGYEALCRWQPPGEAMVPPDRFIPVAEDSGLIVPLGDWVLRQACQQLRRWHELGHTHLSVSVNLSARQFLARDISAKIGKILEDTGVPPSHLHLELTESVLLEQGEEINATLDGLKKLGIKLVLDDFGTGYSSLSYLHRLPLDQIKIDRQFIDDMIGNPAARELVMAIISMARCLHLEVLAEGIESEQQLEMLTEMGCNHFQGYLFGKPVPESGIELQ